MLAAQGRLPKSYSGDEYMRAIDQAKSDLADTADEPWPSEEMRQEAALLTAGDGPPSAESVRTMLAVKRHLREAGFDAEPGKPLPADVDQEAFLAAEAKVRVERESAIISLAEFGASDSKISEMLGIVEREVLSVRTRLAAR